MAAKENPPGPKRDRGGIGRTVVRSPVVVVARHADACPPPLGTHLDASAADAAVLLFLLPMPSLVQPVYLSESILVLLSSSLTWQIRSPAPRRFKT